MPESFEGFEGIIKRTYDQLVEAGHIQPQPEPEAKTVPLDLDVAKKAGKVRLEPVKLLSQEKALFCGCNLGSVAACLVQLFSR